MRDAQTQDGSATRAGAGHIQTRYTHDSESHTVVHGSLRLTRQIVASAAVTRDKVLLPSILWNQVLREGHSLFLGGGRGVGGHVDAKFGFAGGYAVRLGRWHVDEIAAGLTYMTEGSQARPFGTVTASWGRAAATAQRVVKEWNVGVSWRLPHATEVGLWLNHVRRSDGNDPSLVLTRRW